jgi:RNA polymerase sigma factor (sigma-70 family)
LKGPALACNDDEVLLERLKRGDAQAFDRLVEIYQDQIARLAHRLLGWRDDPDDLVQEVFLAALKQVRSFRGECSLGTWLTAITIRTCRSWRRSWRRQLKRLVNAAELYPRTVDSSDAPLLREEVSAMVREAVCRLAQLDREVVVLYYLEQRTVAEITEILGSSTGAIDVRLHRARGRLRESLAGLLKE